MITLTDGRFTGGAACDPAEAPLAGGAWYTGTAPGDGIEYQFAVGTLASAKWMSADFLLDGDELAVFAFTLREGEAGRQYQMSFAVLNQCQARARIPLSAVLQNRWMYDREGAWLKPLSSGDVVDLAKVDRMAVALLRIGPKPVRWCMTPWTATEAEPARLDRPLLPRGRLVDEMGQSTGRQWPTRTRSVQEMIDRLQAQLAAVPQQAWPAGWSRWGGDAARKLTGGTGFFATHHDGRRWWLVDPDGHAFWSAGQDCVNTQSGASVAGIEAAVPEMPDHPAVQTRRPNAHFVNFLAANLIRAFGEDRWYDCWAQVALAELRRSGFNTIGNWSDWKTASKAAFPYVRPLEFRATHVRHIFRDFPDVFDPAFERDADSYAQQLVETRDDPAMVGYFLMNEPTWGFARQTPAEGMLLNAGDCATRRRFDQCLAERGRTTPTPADLEAFSTLMVDHLFTVLTSACHKVDSHHLNLGARYYTIPPDWCLTGMRSFDVFSFNCYRQRIPGDEVTRVARLLHRPLLVGEWHFGALDAGLPATGIGHVPTQADRGRAYRCYLEDAAAHPDCIGVHHFILYDQPYLGRFDGENYNIGFIDVCHRPYEPLVEAARQSHERMYAVAAGEVAPYADAPAYLPMLFM